jgi:hypothetical protein
MTAMTRRAFEVSRSVPLPADDAFARLADLPHYDRWLPARGPYRATVEVDPYPVRIGTTYHDGDPSGSGRSWRGEVSVFDRPTRLTFRQRVRVDAIRAEVDTVIGYELLEAGVSSCLIRRRVELDIRSPVWALPLLGMVQRAFASESRRVLVALAESGSL